MSSKNFTNESEPHEINITDTYGEQWKGTFTYKIKMSGGELMRASQLRRQYLGVNSQAATQAELGIAQIYSQLDVRIVKSPSWWKEAGGQNIPYDVAVEAFTQAMKVEDDYIQTHNEEARKAREQLRADKAKEEAEEKKAAGEE